MPCSIQRIISLPIPTLSPHLSASIECAPAGSSMHIAVPLPPPDARPRPLPLHSGCRMSPSSPDLELDNTIIPSHLHILTSLTAPSIVTRFCAHIMYSCPTLPSPSPFKLHARPPQYPRCRPMPLFPLFAFAITVVQSYHLRRSALHSLTQRLPASPPA